MKITVVNSRDAGKQQQLLLLTCKYLEMLFGWRRVDTVPVSHFLYQYTSSERIAQLCILWHVPTVMATCAISVCTTWMFAVGPNWQRGPSNSAYLTPIQARYKGQVPRRITWRTADKHRDDRDSPFIKDLNRLNAINSYKSWGCLTSWRTGLLATLTLPQLVPLIPRSLYNSPQLASILSL